MADSDPTKMRYDTMIHDGYDYGYDDGYDDDDDDDIQPIYQEL